MSNKLRIWRHRARVAEAMVWLVLARVLIRHVSLRVWRSSLGRIAQEMPPDSGQTTVMFERAVERAAARLPGDIVCLPRAMALQWMLKRRGHASALLFGVLRERRDGDIRALHAWVEVGGRTVIGADPERSFVRIMALVQP